MDELSPEIVARVNTWLDDDYDQDTRREIQALIDQKNWKELTDAFYRDLEFGTGGLRGIMGAGTNRINKYTLAMATQGLSNYLRKVYPEEQVRVVIAHDNRNNASKFARVVAEVFAANGIYVYFFDGMRPTPELSFAIRELGCHSGVMLTASHNPKEYSGYKAYWRDGGQVIDPHDRKIIDEVGKIRGIGDVRFDADEDLIETIGEEMDRKYIAKLTEVSVSPDAVRRQSDMRIVYSPIHGAGIAGVPQVLEAFGFRNVTLVKEQCIPDGNFPTVVYPNPEEHEALTLAIEKAREVDAELIMATDPDVDRVGIAVKDDRGDYILLNGNETGCLLINYLRGIGDVRFDADEDLIETIGEEMDRKYIAKLTEVSVSPDAVRRQSDMRIVYSPIHGAGIAGVPQVLEAFGFRNVTLVKEQCIPDGNFPTVVYPNPEEHEALTLAIEKAREVDAELIMATDPDVDRVGIAVKDDRGDYILLNGNETGCLLINYLLMRWDELGKLTDNEYIVTTIVTSYLMDRIAEARGVECYNVLTGFKYIGALMTELEDEKTFIAGGEESYGYLVGDHARDKDAVVSCASIAEMTAYYRDQGRTLYEAMLDMYERYGFYREKLVSITKKGKEGSEEIAATMERLRKRPPTELGGSSVVRILDYQARIEVDVRTGNARAIELPRSNVLQLVMEDGSIVSARPSGTEPKIKFYCSTTGTLGADRDYRGLSKKLDDRIDEMLGDLGVL